MIGLLTLETLEPANDREKWREQKKTRKTFFLATMAGGMKRDRSFWSILVEQSSIHPELAPLRAFVTATFAIFLIINLGKRKKR